MRTIAFIYLIFSTLSCFSQSFEAERGGFYFFAPSKTGFVGFSTVALNIGVGEYVSSGNAITTYFDDGTKMGSSSVDCRDGLTAGFANVENDYSYLLSYFINKKNSVYKLTIYQADKEADLNRVTVNLKSKFGTILGKGRYVLDLKYAVATNNSIVFVIGKYFDNVETFYLVQVKNENDVIEIKELNVTTSDQELENGETTSPQFIYDGNQSIYVVQLANKNEQYFLQMRSVGLDGLVLSKERKVTLEFVNKGLMLCESSELENPRAYESTFSSVINRGSIKSKDFLKFDFFSGNIFGTGLFYHKLPDSLKNRRADGVYNFRVNMDIDEVNRVEAKMNFEYSNIEDVTPKFFTAFGVTRFYWSYLQATDNYLWLSLNAVQGDIVHLKKGGPEQAVLKYLDKKNVIPEKHLKTGKSILIETLNSFYCLYHTHTNSVGFYTKFSLKEFPK